MSLKAAFGWSAVFHMVLLTLHPPQGFVPVEEERPIRVTYVPALQHAASPGAEKVKPQPAPVAAKPLPVSAEKPPEASAPPRSVPPPVVSPPPPVPTAQNQPVTVRDVPTPTSSSSVISNLPEGEFAGLQHKQRVRQHLKAHLVFPTDGIQGTVRLRLILAPNGSVKDLLLLETSDSRLAEMALQGAQSAEPYPPFPAHMKKSQVLYEYIIQYRLE